MHNSFKNQRILVIGGSSGIGQATAAMAAEAGALVTIASRSEIKLAAALKVLPTGVAQVLLDVTQPEAVAAFFTAHPAWDHVVLTGSDTQVGTVQSLPLAQAHAAMNSKFWGAYYVGQQARIVAGGSLTFVSGVYSIRPQATAVLQGAINAALESLTRGLAVSLAPDVRVNAVSPSTTDTPLWDRLGSEGKTQKMKWMRERLLLKRVAQAEDIAQAILFVASNRFATGSTVLIDGGDALV